MGKGSKLHALGMGQQAVWSPVFPAWEVHPKDLLACSSR